VTRQNAELTLHTRHDDLLDIIVEGLAFRSHHYEPKFSCHTV
jgi:hypothetical protein